MTGNLLFCRHNLEKSLLVDPWNTVKEADLSMINIYFKQYLLQAELSCSFLFYLYLQYFFLECAGTAALVIDLCCRDVYTVKPACVIIPNVFYLFDSGGDGGCG